MARAGDEIHLGHAGFDFVDLCKHVLPSALQLRAAGPGGDRGMAFIVSGQPRRRLSPLPLPLAPVSPAAMAAARPSCSRCGIGHSPAAPETWGQRGRQPRRALRCRTDGHVGAYFNRSTLNGPVGPGRPNGPQSEIVFHLRPSGVADGKEIRDRFEPYTGFVRLIVEPKCVLGEPGEGARAAESEILNGSSACRYASAQQTNARRRGLAGLLTSSPRLGHIYVGRPAVE